MTVLLLILVVVLLWLIHQDLGELADRQRGVKLALERIHARLDALAGDLKEFRETAGDEVLIAVNTASKTQLRRLPRVGAVLADRIIAGRPYAGIEDFARVEGMSPQVLDALRDHVSFD